MIKPQQIIPDKVIGSKGVGSKKTLNDKDSIIYSLGIGFNQGSFFVNLRPHEVIGLQIHT